MYAVQIITQMSEEIVSWMCHDEQAMWHLRAPICNNVTTQVNGWFAIKDFVVYLISGSGFLLLTLLIANTHWCLIREAKSNFSLVG